MSNANRLPLDRPPLPTDAEMAQIAAGLWDVMRRRRSVRDFSTGPVPREVIDLALRVAGSLSKGRGHG